MLFFVEVERLSLRLAALVRPHRRLMGARQRDPRVQDLVGVLKRSQSVGFGITWTFQYSSFLGSIENMVTKQP